VLTAGNAAVLDALSASGRLLHVHDYAHKYPYDWRTKKPVIVRATQQVCPQPSLTLTLTLP